MILSPTLAVLLDTYIFSQKEKEDGAVSETKSPCTAEVGKSYQKILMLPIRTAGIWRGMSANPSQENKEARQDVVMNGWPIAVKHSQIA